MTNNSRISDENINTIMSMKMNDFFYHLTEVKDELIVQCNIRSLSIRASFRKETLEIVIQVGNHTFWK